MFASIITMPCDPVPAFQWPHPGHRNFSTTFPSRKNQRSLRCATQMQADYCVHLEHDSHVERYWAQPHVFTWMNGSNRYRYTPHFLVENDDGSGCYCEIQANFDSVTAQRRETTLAFESLCREQGWQYHRIAGAAVHGAAFATLQKLYLRSLDTSIDELTNCIQVLPTLIWPATVRELLRVFPDFSLPALCCCIFSGQLKADLSQAFNLDLVIQGPAIGESNV